MRIRDLILRSLAHFRRTHLGVTIGAACAAAVLVGALAVGDSVRLSLRDQAMARIGGIDIALVGGERFFRSELAKEMVQDPEADDAWNTLTIAPCLQLQGFAKISGTQTKTGIVQTLGVDERFFALAPADRHLRAPAAGKAYVSAHLANQLDLQPGASFLLRIEKPSLLPRDLAMATIEDVSFALPLEVEEVLSDDDFGRFGLNASQIPPGNVFLSLPWLQEQLELQGRANLLLIGGSSDIDGLLARADRSLRQCWSLADAELAIRVLESSNSFELTSDRVFLEAPVIEAMTAIEPKVLGILSYFVNALTSQDRSTPYSTVCAIGPLTSTSGPHLQNALTILPEDMPEDGMVLNSWCAKDLQADIGDSVELDYFIMGSQLQLETATRTFKIHAITPITGIAADAELMPDLPGLTNSEHCRDWEPGIPIKLDRIRDIDEKYWDDHRGTPKAFISLQEGRSLWGNRFGTLTAIRGNAALASRIEQQLPRELDPARIGLFFRDLRGPALSSGTSATDFGGLFLGLSFFLILAALVLTSLLFMFGVEQRAGEIGLLLALGFRPAQVRRLILLEAMVLATAGAIVGTGLGMGYTRIILHFLGTLWQEAVGMTTLEFHVQPSTIATGVLASILVAVIAIFLTLRKAIDRPAVDLLASRNGIPPPVMEAGRGHISLAMAILCPILAAALALSSDFGSTQAAGTFFGAGALLLIGAMAACRLLLIRIGQPGKGQMTSLLTFGLRNAGRRPGRSLATIALLASGVFLVISVQAHRLEPPKDPGIRSSGTGGFALFGTSTLPVLRDLSTSAGREAFGLEDQDLQGVSVVAMRVQDGDDASCLNLNLPSNPTLLGVPAQSLAEREAFSFAQVLPPPNGFAPENPWSLLDHDYGDGVVPAIGDQASVTWSLHKSLGDKLDYRDENGQRFQVQIVGTIANSILQGNLLVSTRHFEERFPSTSGFSRFLIDAPTDRAQSISTNLTDAMEDIGLALTSTRARLAEFNAVQNTYLLIFQALGGLGLLLGSVGLGMVVLRNALERRSELALVSALGFPSRSVRNLVWNEHGILLGLGLLSGAVTALVAILPSFGNETLPVMSILIVVGSIAISGAAWVWLASFLATRGPLVPALGND